MYGSSKIKYNHIRRLLENQWNKIAVKFFCFKLKGSLHFLFFYRQLLYIMFLVFVINDSFSAAFESIELLYFYLFSYDARIAFS